MRHAGGRLDHGRALKLCRRSGQSALEKPGAVAEKHRRQVNTHLVEQSRRQILLRDVRAAADRDVTLAGGEPRLLERGLDAVAHEREAGSALLGERVTRMPGED